jgi:uncharacterized protein (TIGR00251 family)
MISVADAVFETDKGVILSIEVAAGSRIRLFPAGLNTWRRTILCRVTASPHKGQANREEVSLIAQVLGIPKTSVRLHAGAASPEKRILVTGVEKQELVARLQSMI